MWLSKVSGRKTNQITVEYDNPTEKGLSLVPIDINNIKAAWTGRRFKEFIATQVGLALQEMILLGHAGTAGETVDINEDESMLSQIHSLRLNTIRVERKKPAEGDVNPTEAHRFTIGMFMFHRGRAASIYMQRQNWPADMKISGGNQAHNKSCGTGNQSNICMTPDNPNRPVDAKVENNESQGAGHQFNVSGPTSGVLEWARSRSATDETNKKRGEEKS